MTFKFFSVKINLLYLLKNIQRYSIEAYFINLLCCILNSFICNVLLLLMTSFKRLLIVSIELGLYLLSTFF